MVKLRCGDIMVNFIICEDEEVLRNSTKNTIVSYMMNHDIDYKIYEFDGYDKKFENMVKKDIGFKIYLLDIVTKNGTGVDAARIIREKYDDWVSVIIMITSHQEYKYEALSSRLFLLDFVNKLDNCNKKLRDDLSISMKYYDKRYKMLSYEYNHTYYRIEYRQIVCIEKEPDSKRCIIITKDGTQIIPGSLHEVLEKLDDRFFKTHKSLIVNLDEIALYEIKNNKITFKNGEETYLISRNKKKELIERVYNRC